MIPIIRWTIWQRRWSTMWWSIGIGFFIFLNMIFYPSFRDQAAQLQHTFDKLPKAALQLFGGSSDFFSPVGFLNSQIFFLMLPLLLAILAISLGSSLIGREEQDTTLETLLARPISRTKLLVAKLIAGGLILGFVTLVSLAITLIIAKSVSIAVPLPAMAVATLACFILVLSLGAVAFLLSATGKARGASIGLSALVGLGGYFVSSLAGTVHWLKVPAKIFPFHYYSPEAILRGQPFKWGNIVFLLIVTAACLVLSWVSFRRRDLG